MPTTSLQIVVPSDKPHLVEAVSNLRQDVLDILATSPDLSTAFRRLIEAGYTRTQVKAFTFAMRWGGAATGGKAAFLSALRGIHDQTPPAVPAWVTAAFEDVETRCAEVRDQVGRRAQERSKLTLTENAMDQMMAAESLGVRAFQEHPPLWEAFLARGVVEYLGMRYDFALAPDEVQITVAGPQP